MPPEAARRARRGRWPRRSPASSARRSRIGKRAFYEQAELPLAAAYAHTGEVMVANMMREDTAEGIGAFLDKRAPDWDQ